MLDLRERVVPMALHIHARRSHVAEWVLGALGVLASALGVWMSLVPPDWFLGGLPRGWGLGALCAAGLLLAAAFGILAWKSYDSYRHWRINRR